MIEDQLDRLYSMCELGLSQIHCLTKAAIKMLHCNYFPDIICVPIFGFVNASLRDHVTTGEPQCNRKQMQSLIMQANVHRLASLMASHRQRAYRTYGVV